MQKQIIRYGQLPNGIVFQETKSYAKAGTGVVSLDDPRLVELPGEEGLWCMCYAIGQFPEDAVETDKAAYDAYQLYISEA